MGVRLSELEAEFVQRTEQGYRRVDDIRQANGVRFACPLCYLANDGLVGTHGILCWDPSVPADITPGPGRWQLTGTSLSDLTLIAGSSSIKLESGCRWHGYVRNGEACEDLDPARVAETRAYWQDQRRKFRQEQPTMNTDSATPGAAPADPTPAAPAATHSPTNVLKWINGELHQLWEGIHPGTESKMVKVEGTATAPGLLHDVETMIEAKVKALVPAAAVDLEAIKTEIRGQLVPMIQKGVAEAMAAFEARLQALEHHPHLNPQQPEQVPAPPPAA